MLKIVVLETWVKILLPITVVESTKPVINKSITLRLKISMFVELCSSLFVITVQIIKRLPIFLQMKYKQKIYF